MQRRWRWAAERRKLFPSASRWVKLSPDTATAAFHESGGASVRQMVLRSARQIEALDMARFHNAYAAGGRKNDEQVTSRRKQKMVGSRNLNRAPTRQVQREWLEGRHVAHFLNILHLHDDPVPFCHGLCNLPKRPRNFGLKDATPLALS